MPTTHYVREKIAHCRQVMVALQLNYDRITAQRYGAMIHTPMWYIARVAMAMCVLFHFFSSFFSSTFSLLNYTLNTCFTSSFQDLWCPCPPPNRRSSLTWRLTVSRNLSKTQFIALTASTCWDHIQYRILDNCSFWLYLKIKF